LLSQLLTDTQSSDEVAAAFDKVGQQGAAIPATASKLVSLTGQALKEAASNKVNMKTTTALALLLLLLLLSLLMLLLTKLLQNH
jgi:hypothetical protein